MSNFFSIWVSLWVIDCLLLVDAESLIYCLVQCIWYRTVLKIMNPEVPIALRMSGHLLFGVVRIYSKKVEYLQHDCNSLRIEISKAYANADINLPEDANQAKYESITLPDNFALI
ncbi:putative rad21/Rec8-like protein [Helianthus annuus]|nr:putative rad21/Rec8-like protein [Helianthus annuus]